MRRVLVGFVAAMLLSAVLIAGVLAPGGKASPDATTKVKVTASEFKYVLSRKTAPKGTIVFTLVNKGKLPHDFKIAGKKTAKIAPGKTATLKVTVTAKSKKAYLCTVPGHAPAGMKGVFAVS
jgi:plastocyanin